MEEPDRLQSTGSQRLGNNCETSYSLSISSKDYIHIHFHVFSIIHYYKILNIVPCAIQLDLVVYFVYSNVYLLIPNS